MLIMMSVGDFLGGIFGKFGDIFQPVRDFLAPFASARIGILIISLIIFFICVFKFIKHLEEDNINGA